MVSDASGGKPIHAGISACDGTQSSWSHAAHVSGRAQGGAVVPNLSSQHVSSRINGSGFYPGDIGLCGIGQLRQLVSAVAGDRASQRERMSSDGAGGSTGGYGWNRTETTYLLELATLSLFSRAVIPGSVPG